MGQPVCGSIEVIIKNSICFFYNNDKGKMMNDVTNIEQSIEMPRWFTTIVWVAFVWNLLGVMAFVMQMNMTPEVIAALPEKEQLMYQNIPLWATIAFGFAVSAGAIGSLCLALKKSLALLILIVSLIGVMVQMYHVFFILDSIAVYGPESAVMPGMVIIIAIGLVVLANKAKTNGWMS